MLNSFPLFTHFQTGVGFLAYPSGGQLVDVELNIFNGPQIVSSMAVEAFIS